MNATTWCPEAALAMRIALFREHLDVDTSALTCRDALRAFRSVAQDNRRKLARNRWDWQGLAFSLDVATYGNRSEVEGRSGRDDRGSKSHRASGDAQTE
jgi:hypothetical protein